MDAITPAEKWTELLAVDRPLIMGIVNVTPDSFYDGGTYNTSDRAVEHALRLIGEGADIVDIGGESTRPPGTDYGAGGRAISLDEELSRVIPVIDRIGAMETGAFISVDTSKSDVARAAVASGAAMINDVSAGTASADMFAIASAARVPMVVMHGHRAGQLGTVDEVHYDDVVESVKEFLRDRIAVARSEGVEHVICDVGIGFAKNWRHNVELVQRYATFTDLGVPTLFGASRKSFLGRILGNAPPSERLEASLAAAGWAVAAGARIVRVHDVAETRRYLRAFQSLTPVRPTM